MFKKNIIKLIIFLCLWPIGIGVADLSDPTEPVDYTTGAMLLKKEDNESLWVVSAILISESHKIAVVNNHIVKVGDKLDDNEVKEIAVNEVKLMNQKKGVLTLRLIEKSVKEQKK